MERILSRMFPYLRDRTRKPAVVLVSAVLSVGVFSALTTPPAGAAQLVPVTANAAEVSPAGAQTIDNIGASGAWWVNDLANFSPTVKNQAARLLFSASGLQLSSYRYNIGGGGIGVTTPARAPQTFLQPDGSYDWSKDPGGQYFLKAAAANSVPDLIGFVNSAPASMTTNSQSCSGDLVSGDEAEYGAYLATIVAHFKQQGIRIGYVSPMNEPDATTGCGQETMLVPVAQRGAIVRATGAAIAAQGSTAKVIADESSQLSAFVSHTPIWLSEPGTAQYVAALAHHTYDNPSTTTMEQAAAVGAKFGKKTWATEICCFNLGGSWSQGYDPGIDSALTMSKIVYNDFTVTHDSAFQWWTALSDAIGCDPGSDKSCAKSGNSSGWNDGLIYYDPAYATDGNQALYLTKRFYALAQYSRYVRPGAILHNVTGAPSGVQVSAYRKGPGWTVVVNNQNPTTSPLSLHFNTGTSLSATGAIRTSATENLAKVRLAAVRGATISAQLPARSITTYTFKENRPSTRGASLTASWQSAASGKCMEVTSSAPTAGTGTAISNCTGAATQTWTSTEDGALTVYGNKCLAPQSDGTTDGTRAAVYPCVRSISQRWSTNADGSITNAATGQCLDVFGQGTADGTPLDLYTCNGGANQRWTQILATS